MSRRTGFLAVFLCALVGLPACDSRTKTLRALPPPTEDGMDGDAEEEHRLERAAWFERMHAAPPGVDWREIERENGRLEQERRNQLAHQRDLLGSNPWAEVGSRNLAGRMECAVIGPDGATVYAGSALGGVWRAALDGTGWTPLADNLYGGVDEMVVLPPDTLGGPDVILAARHDGLVHASRDGGATWLVPAGLGGLSTIRNVGQLADGVQTVLVLARGAATGNRATLFASMDHARTFSVRWQGASGFDGGLWIPRVGAGAVATVYLAHDGSLLRSVNSGSSFSTIGTIDASAASARLTGSEAGSPTLYAAVSSAGVWKLDRSTDGGTTWSYVRTLDDFWERLGSSIVSSSVVFYGGVELHRSTNGGASFAVINTWGQYYGDPAHKLHADIDGIFTWPEPGGAAADRVYFCTDGGVYESRNQGVTVQNLSLTGLGVSQYYSTLTSRSNPALILAGAQDQGYQRGSLSAPSGSGPSTPFTQLISGDYGHLTSSDGTHSIVYSTYPGFVLVQQGQNAPSLSTLDFPAGSNHAWLPPVVADPLSAGTFFFCGDRLTRYVHAGGNTWTQAQHSTFNFAVNGASYISGLAFAPSDGQRAYAVTDAGWRYRSTDHGVTWTVAGNASPGDHYFYGNTIVVHPTNALEVAIGGSGYGTPAVIRSTDGGVSWQSIVAGLPQTLVYGLVFAEDGTGDLYAATEAGAYHWIRAANVWENIMGNQAPATLYWSVESASGGATIRFGTYGRGIWDYVIPPTPDLTCRYGNVDTGSGGAPAMVLTVNGSGGDAYRREMTIFQSTILHVGLASAPAGPGAGRFAVWVWATSATNLQSLVVSGNTLGCVVNPTPFHAANPQPFRCLRGGLGLAYCGSVREIRGVPSATPWILTRNQGINRTITFELQGVVDDANAANASGLSVTNAVFLHVQ
ncbi:MAG: hypothetical protein HYR85_16675 [Planctomycetes bacterium]|nr:hypothetical protein [Planctomycetota bacterium]